jgi:uncharacterized 2Fe-2S/4Fe-4S cluster protein (DUF4445 family)
MPRVTFLPEGISRECSEGETVFEVGRSLGIGIETACIGQATCGLCRVRVVSGAEFLSPYSPAEEKHLGNVYHLTGVRLSCQSRVLGGEVVVELVTRRRTTQHP